MTEEDKKLMKKQTGIDIIETSAKNSFKIKEVMKIFNKKLIEKSVQRTSGVASNNNNIIEEKMLNTL